MNDPVEFTEDPELEKNGGEDYLVGAFPILTLLGYWVAISYFIAPFPLVS